LACIVINQYCVEQQKAIIISVSTDPYGRRLLPPSGEMFMTISTVASTVSQLQRSMGIYTGVIFDN